jgi:hypothetical protein
MGALIPLAAILDVLKPLNLGVPCLDGEGDRSRLRELEESLWMSMLGIMGADL